MNRILVVKLGYTETLDNILSLTTSLGDVLRTTFILHFFKDYHVSWLVDERAVPLLEKNKNIDEILVYEPVILKRLKKEKFDIVINFEKLPEVCALVHGLESKNFFGFGANGLDGDTAKHPGKSKELVNLSQDVNKRRENKDYWQRILADSLGKSWGNQEYILGYTPKKDPVYDIGFNWSSSAKWTNKMWPKSHWRELESLLGSSFSISWQQGLKSLYEYIDWINSCRLIVTSDSLALHLCFALKKRVIALFGPTSHSEIYFYNCGTFLLPSPIYDCIPCLKPVCSRKPQCISNISPERVKERIEDEFKNHISA